MVRKLFDPRPLPQLPTYSHSFVISSCWSTMAALWITWGPLKAPVPKPHPRPIKSGSGLGPRNQYFLKLPRWFKYVAKVENYCPSRKCWNKIPADLHLWFHPDCILHSGTKPFCQRCEHARSPWEFSMTKWKDVYGSQRFYCLFCFNSQISNVQISVKIRGLQNAFIFYSDLTS